MPTSHITRRQLVGLAAGAGLAAALPTAAWAQRKQELRLAHLISESEPTHAATLRWVDAIKSRTNGALDVKVFPNSQLGSEKDVVEQARLGANVAHWTSTAFLSESTPDFGVMWAPFAFNDANEVFKVLNSPIFQRWQQKLLETRKLRILSFNWLFGSRHIMTTKRAIVTPEDMKGLKIRSVPVPVTISTMRQLGASPTPLAFSEVYPAMQQGVIDGLEVPLSTMYGSKLYEVGKHISLTAHVIQVQGWTIGEQYFQSLTKEMRNILIEESVNAGQWCTKTALESEAQFKQQLAQAGVVFTEPDRAAFAAVGERAVREFSTRWSSGLFDEVKRVKSA